jgi:hypothetical protein
MADSSPYACKETKTTRQQPAANMPAREIRTRATAAMRARRAPSPAARRARDAHAGVNLIGRTGSVLEPPMGFQTWPALSAFSRARRSSRDFFSRSSYGSSV